VYTGHSNRYVEIIMRIQTVIDDQLYQQAAALTGCLVTKLRLA
jgi:Arc/MetJ family transcription regulator